MTVYTYNLTTFQIEEVEVDEIRGGKAIKKRPAKGKLNEVANNATYNKFSLTKKDAEEIVCSYLRAEIAERQERMLPLQKRLHELQA